MNYGYNFGPGLMRSSMAPISFMGAPSLVNPSSVSALGGATSRITFSSILNGASKTLGVINQAIPVFYQVKPIWNNAKTMFRVVKGINSSDDDLNSSIKSETKKEQVNAPTFFA